MTMQGCSYDPQGSFGGEKSGGLRDPQIYVIKFDSLGKVLKIYGIKFGGPLTPTFSTTK